MGTKLVNAAQTKTILVKPDKLIKGLSGLVSAYLTGKPEKVADAIPDFISSGSSGDEASNRLWELISKALSRSVANLLIEHQSSLHVDAKRLSRFAVENSVGEQIAIEIPDDFLLRPNRANFLNDILPRLRSWMEVIGLSPQDAVNLVERIRATFTLTLLDEWRSRAAYYSPAVDLLTTPFDPAATSLTERTAYRAYLASMPDEAVFEETFSLRQIYIPLRCTWERSKQPKQFLSLGDSEHERRIHHDIGWLEDEVLKWVADKDGPPVCLISGGPGSGKSTFSKILVSNLATSQDISCLFIPLHLLDLSLSITDGIDDYLKSSELFSHPVMDEMLKEDHLLIVFDGLDELQLQGQVAQDVSQVFIGELLRFIELKNIRRKRVSALITGRDVAVQSTETTLKARGRVIHVAPYTILSNYPFALDDKLDVYKLDQRNEWWTKYGFLVGSEYEGIPPELKTGELNDVTVQPLLNYLVALSIKQGLIVNSSTNINTVYDYLLQAVFERGWARNPHPALKDLTQDQFKRLLEEVATSVWHGAGRTTTLREIEEHCTNSNLGKILPSLEAGASAGVSKLLLAFYFRQKGLREGDKTFEFTHKSFAEYLISLRVVRLIDQISRRLEENLGDSDSGWDLQTCLLKWIEVMGRSALDDYIAAFIRREIAAATDSASWKKALEAMLNGALQTRLPLHRSGALNFREAAAWDRNAEEALFVCVNACARARQEVVRLKQPTATSIGECLRRLQGQRLGPANRPILSSLSFMDFSGACLDIMDLYAADLRHSILRDVEFHYTNLALTQMDGADLRGAQFLNTNIEGARFARALFNGPLGQDSFLGADVPAPRSRKRSASTILKSRGAIVEA